MFNSWESQPEEMTMIIAVSLIVHSPSVLIRFATWDFVDYQLLLDIHVAALAKDQFIISAWQVDSHLLGRYFTGLGYPCVCFLKAGNKPAETE